MVFPPGLLPLGGGLGSCDGWARGRGRACEGVASEDGAGGGGCGPCCLRGRVLVVLGEEGVSAVGFEDEEEGGGAGVDSGVGSIAEVLLLSLCS